MSVLLATADALTTDLNAAAFSLPFAAERTYADWDLPLAKAATEALRVDVVPVAAMVSELDTRGSISYDVTAQIVVRKKLAHADMEQVDSLDLARVKAASVDPLVELVEEIHDYLIAERLTSFDSAVWSESKIEAACVPKHLRQQQFTAIIRVTYQVSVQLP